MSYKFEKNPDTGNRELVVSGFEKGIASSPYLGIANMTNLSASYYPGVAYVNYRRQASSISLVSSTNLGPFTLTGGPSGGATSATLFTVDTTTIAYLTSGTSYIVPADWNSLNNTIECIGGGGEGGLNTRGGGGGGGYSKTTNLALTAFASITYAVGAGGAGGAGNGGDTYFNGASLAASSVGAKGGQAGQDPAGGQGGQAASGVGSTKYNGGDGGAVGGTGAGGGGGAAGPNSAGTVGSAGSGANGGNGGAGGSGGGGAGGTHGNPPTAGSNGTEWDASHGSGGGGGGADAGGVSAAAGIGGRYGGGGGGATLNSAGVGGDGYQGVIRITYTNTTGLWAYPTGVYQVTFSNGDVRNVTFTLGAATMTWSGGLTGAATSTITPVYAIATGTMTNPIQKATSPVGLNYLLDDSGRIWRQTAVNASTWGPLVDLSTSAGTGGKGLGYWNNYLVVFRTDRIEFCGDGTASGVTDANWNKASTSSTITVTSALRAMYVAGVPASPVNFNFTVAPITGATSATLNTAWTGPSGAYPVRFSNGGSDVRTVTFTQSNTGVSWSGGLGTDCSTTGFDMYQWAATNNTFSGSTTFVSGSAVKFSSTGTLPTGITTGFTYYLQQTVDMTGIDSTFYITATINSTSFANAIMLTDAGTGTITMTLVPSIVPPITNTTITGFSWGTQGIGSTTITLASNWLGATGIYNIIDPSGNNFTGAFTYNSTNVTLPNPAAVQIDAAGTFTVQIINTTASSNRVYISKVDGNLYFANGRWVGRIQSSPNINMTFNPGIPASYSVNYSATGTLQSQDTVVDMTDLQGTMVIAGNYDIYPWDYVSAQPGSSSPVGELIVRLVNLLNNVYILAGTKGNIYLSNGFSAQIMYKLPDCIAGVIDPIWKWGDIMVHRSKLFFQAIAQTSGATNILAGIFSIVASSAAVGEGASGLVMEAQNSYGLTPASGALQNGALMDNETWANQDSYYSAWSNGATTGGIDYNDTSGWQNFEPAIETDIIPIGNYLNKTTFGNIEFKLDRPMVSGDQIRMYWRPSLSDSYTLMGTTTTAVLADYYKSNITQSQWAQFKIQFKCASSSSSYLPLREVRLHYN